MNLGSTRMFMSNYKYNKHFLTLSERMLPYSRHHKYSKKIECRHRGKKKNSRFLLEL